MSAILDTTLRDGAQMVDVDFSIKARCQIARALSSAGVREIELGFPGAGPQQAEAASAIVALQLPAQLSGWCRAFKADVNAAVEAGVDIVHISLPCSSILLNAFDKDACWVFRAIVSVIEKAVESGPTVSVGLQDVSRSEPSFVHAVTAACVACGVRRIKFADSVGIWLPYDVSEFFQSMRKRFPDIDLGFHAHNDLGLATANSLTALLHGADLVDVTLGGIGERSGNAALEQVVAAAFLRTDLDLGVDTRTMKGLAELLTQNGGISLPDNQPVVGSNVFRHESGIHVRALEHDCRSYEPCAPTCFGHQGRVISFGQHSGRSGIVACLQAHGITVSEANINALLLYLKGNASTARQSNRSVTETELCNKARELNRLEVAS